MSCAVLSAQTAAEYRERYERQVRNLGYDGVGVETIIDRWEEIAPEDPDMLMARFNYNLAKSRTSAVLPMGDRTRYLGEKPSLSLKDSDGRDVNYFEVTSYDESYFSVAMNAVDRAIDLYPDELRYRYNKLSALLAYEKESPDMTASALRLLIDYNSSSHPSWTLDGEAVGEDVFQQGIGEYLYSFFRIGSEISYEYFFGIATRMSKLYPKNTVFINDIGSYYQVARKNDRQALKFYRKALKIDPDDYAANRNILIIQSSQSKKGRSSK